MSLPEISVRQPVTTVMVFAAIALLGSVAFFKLNLDLLPDIEPPAVSVITTYPGASATDVESEVTKYLEDQLSTTPNLDRLESKSKDNISIVNCIFDWGTDLAVATNDIREKIDLARPELADQAEDPFVFKFSSSMVPILVVTVTAKESRPDLYRIVDKQIADPLKRIPGVGAIVYVGGQERQINVYFDREAIEAYHLSVQQVRNVLAAENLNLPAGTVKIERKELQMRVAGRYMDMDEIANTVIGSAGDAFVRLRDVATITDGFEEQQEWARSGELPAIALIFTVTALNLISFIGVIMLMGIVVKNAIVLVDYTKQLRVRGMNLREAIVTGGRTRLRPVLMTSLTTIFSMIPLVLSKGEGSEVWNALGVTIIGGLMISGIVTLLLVPLVYSLVHQSRATTS